MSIGPPLPENLELRSIAEALEGAAISGEILDSHWRIVFISSEEARIIGVDPQMSIVSTARVFRGANSKTVSTGLPATTVAAIGGS